MKKPIVSVDLVIQRGSKILLGKVSNKWDSEGKYVWGLPRREIEFGDSFEETVKKNLSKDIAVGILVEAQGEPQIRNSDWVEWNAY